MTSLVPQLALGDRYTLIERIAVGGMGEVWRARDGLLDRPVAVKVLKEEYAADPTFVQRFRNEAKHTAALSHPGIANVFDYGEVGDTAYLVMELVDGEPLSAVLAREGSLSAERALDVVGQAGLALQAAHEVGVIHRDVKPGNLLLRPDGVVKVTDFGIARVVDATPVTQTGFVVGTAAYLSPEQAAGHAVTPASDVYSLGVVAYECLAGSRPFQADSAMGVAMAHATSTPPSLPADVPPVVADFVMRSLDKDPARRQASAGDFGRTALALAAQLREPARGEEPPRTATAVLPAAEEVAAPRPVPRDDAAERRRIRNLFLATGAGVVLLGFLLLYACTGGGPGSAVVPKVTGQDYGTAAAALEKRGFDVRRDQVHSTQHRGTVLDQSVRAGRRVSTDRTIVLTVASGPRLITVAPADYLGRPGDTVAAELTKKGLSVTTAVSPLADATPGTVTDVAPSGSVREGTTVTVTVAVGLTGNHPKKPPGHEKHGHDD